MNTDTDIKSSLNRIMIPGSSLDRRRNWEVFRIFNLYRLFLAAALLGIFIVDQQSRFLGQINPPLFLWTAIVYMILVVIAIIGSYLRRPSLALQAHIQTGVDLIGLSLLIHASGGVSSNLSILLVTAIAASSILLPLYSALLAAALAFFTILGHWVYMAWYAYQATIRITPPDSGFSGYLQANSEDVGRIGILGASFFTAALLTYTLAERARRSDALARQRSQELLDMAILNQAIVRHLQSGIVVVDHATRIRLMNEKARDLLNRHEAALDQPLEAVSPLLHHHFNLWSSGDRHDPKPFRPEENLPEINVRFSPLGDGKTRDTLIFLEDYAQVTQRLQQLKLAALGRLTASIAHEIRNPLTSISHAAQLLQESAAINGTQRRLSEIIHENTKRANKTITSILDLSRRDKIKLDTITLRPWLEEFQREFVRGYGTKTPEMAVDVQPAELTIRFDPHYLHQIVWNLCTNACLHGAPDGQTPRVRLAAYVEKNRVARAFLDVIDFGTGIPEKEAKKLFEPFFTTKSQGTGLGLYISREMCEANDAQLNYIRLPQGGSCFRITLAYSSTMERES